MWRYLAGAGAALLLVAAGVFFFRGTATAPMAQLLPAAPAATAAATPLPDTVPEADARTREQKRFDRTDKDRNGTITRDEYFTQRHKMFAKMDSDHDGKLSFDEWAFRAIDKFATADKDHSNTLSREEFATTALKRKPKPACACGKPAPVAAAAPNESDDE